VFYERVKNADTVFCKTRCTVWDKDRERCARVSQKMSQSDVPDGFCVWDVKEKLSIMKANRERFPASAAVYEAKLAAMLGVKL
jgi:hypothetical protein